MPSSETSRIIRTGNRSTCPNAPRGSQMHVSGDAREYINQLPPRGSKDFPVGTILLKTMLRENGKQDIFAMVKRGAGYNPKGALGWEWFELSRRADDSLAIVWRGLNPPDGHGYGGVPTGGCNGLSSTRNRERFRTRERAYVFEAVSRRRTLASKIAVRIFGTRGDGAAQALRTVQPNPTRSHG